MTDANLVRVLQPQTRRRVGLLAQPVVGRGPDAVREQLQTLRQSGVGLAVADAVANDDLLTLAEACADLPLITAGSGVALGLPPAYARRGWLQPDTASAHLAPVQGPAAVLAGSCSQATQGQVANWIAAGHTALRLDPLALASNPRYAQDLQAQALAALSQGPVLVYATADTASVKGVQDRLGTAAAGELVEHTMASLAQALVQAGVRRLVVAGGETSGAVTQALDQSQLRIGAPICPGVPWTQGSWQGEPMWLALKSGNFGGPDFFAQALRLAGVRL